MKKITLILLCLFSVSFFTVSFAQSPIVKEENIAQKTNIADTYISKNKSIKIKLNLKEVFFASPVIYSVLLTMSTAALIVWLYSVMTFRKRKIIDQTMLKELKLHLYKNDYDTAINYCRQNPGIFTGVVKSVLDNRKHGQTFIADMIKSEGKRATAICWQRLSLLNDIVVAAPMLGLLGTVWGTFYAFYNINRTLDSMTAMFDGLGIACGTTVAGLAVAIIAMICHTTLKYRIITMLNSLEEEVLKISNLIKIKKVSEE
jgi:biopolymer transport protein ExbB